MKFTDLEPVKKEEKLDEIFQYITDERILRVLLELKIFKLREIQKEAIKKGVFFQKSFLVCAPSGSGKTLIGEICAVNNVFQKFGKSIYLVPYKALATEKYVHFKKSYERFRVKVELSIGDYDIDDARLEQADILVTTYEKMDSILRNFSDKEWIFDISTIIIDEIHILGDASGSRGPRLESLIVRLNEFLHNPQIIGLSATIANPKFFNDWLSSLGNKTTLIMSDVRPVPLQYRIEITQNKDSTIKKIIKATLDNGGQVLIFLNKRKSTQQTARNIKNLVKTHITESELRACKKIEEKLDAIKGRHLELKKVVKCGVAFHHAGLLPKERKLIEDAYRKHLIKVICSTTTLSAGVNLPSRVVIVKDFKKYVTSGHNIKNFSGFYENGDGFSYFMPFSANSIFQMLGRAGRPGLDSEGFGYLLINDLEERDWVEDHYFQDVIPSGVYIPKYNDLTSGLNQISTLKEQVLLRIYEEKHITLEKLKDFFQKTYFWHGIKNKMERQGIPIDQLLMIKEITPKNILKLHSDPQKVKKLMVNHHQIKITKLSKSNVSGYVKTDFGVFFTEFDSDVGIRCTCGFQNGISNDYSNEQFTFEFCDHITAFLIYLINIPDDNFQKYVNDIVPKSVKHQYILNYLFEKGLITMRDDGTINCTQFGKLIIRLYLYPVSGVLIRYKLENAVLETFQDIVKEAYEVLKAELKVRNYRLLQPILEWCDEEPLDDIIERHKIMTGDLYTTKDNLERIITFIGIIAVHLSESDLDLQEEMIKIAEIAETLKIRIHYGIHEELFDLVLRLDNVARVRARILYNAGFHTATQVKKQNPYVLNRKTGLGINLCKKIIKGK
ncbi:MAG: DEAD/DEAH box helicase [Candidatus Lokiarchaeota archaeon]|nr:DEAD/DEAH box helicase [Candidatus Lokiarchaeota archaeon]